MMLRHGIAADERESAHMERLRRNLGRWQLPAPDRAKKGGDERLPPPYPGIILISNKMLYLKSRVFHTLVPHVPCVTSSHKNLTRLAL